MDEISSTTTKLAPLPLHFDEFCDIVGGQSWLQFIYNLKTNEQQHRVKSVSKLKSALTGKHRFLCTSDLLDRQVLEIFYIKLSALVRTTQVVKDAHQLLSAPLLNISNRSIGIGMHSTQSLAPSLWNYRLVYDRSEPSNPLEYSDPNNSDGNHTISPQQDFYSLGMLIIRTLLVNRSQSMETVKFQLDQLGKTITDIYNANKHSVGHDELQSKLVQVLDSFLNEDTFKQCNLIYKPRYYTKDLVNPVLWRGTISIAFRLITQIPGFSFYSNQSNATLDVWEISQDIFEQLSDAEHQAKRNLLSESINPSTDIHKVISELTDQDNWQAEYFNSDNTLKQQSNNDIVFNKHNEMIEIDIFGLEEDLSSDVMFTENTSPRSNNDSSITMEYFDSIIEE